MTHTVPPWPLDATPDETAAGFSRMVLSLGNFVGAYPGEDVEVMGRRLSVSDVLIKVRITTRQGKIKVYYRHLRFGYPTVREKARSLWLWRGQWRSWFRGRDYWPWTSMDWQHVPGGHYDCPTDDCSRTLAWPGVVGLAFDKYAV